MKRAEFKMILLSLVFISSFFLIAELSTRLFWDNWQDPKSIYRVGNIVRHELAPNKKVVVKKQGKEYLVVTNSDGLRNREVALDKGSLFRILGLGDSITFGSFVEAEETYLYRLEGMLNSNVPVKRFEVINAGVPGYGTIHELAILEKKLIKYKPDLIIVGFCMNDVEDTDGYKPLNSFTYIARKSALYNFLVHHIGYIVAKANICLRGGTAYNPKCSSSRGASLEFLNKGYSGHMAKAWEKTKSALEGIHNIARAGNAETVLVIFPYAAQLFQDRRPDPQSILAEFARERGIFVIDLWDAFKKERTKHKLYLENNSPYDGWHPNSYGHEIIAREIYRFIKANRIIDIMNKKN